MLTYFRNTFKICRYSIKGYTVEEEVVEVPFSFKVPKGEKDRAMRNARRFNSDLTKELRKLVTKLANSEVVI